MVRTLIAGNWKMNDAMAEIPAISDGVEAGAGGVDVLVCPPATLVGRVADAARGSELHVGGQTCHTAVSGAHTGDVSADMLRAAGATYVIVGHSERRADHGESDEMVAAQAEAAITAGLTPIICIGETLDQRDAGETLDVIAGQLAGSVPGAADGKDFVIAYEPVWAIGTGRTATTEQIGEVHAAIRSALTERFDGQGAGTRILYGGSMKPGNAADILSVGDVNGGLIGGASLKAVDFLAICEAAQG